MTHQEVDQARRRIHDGPAERRIPVAQAQIAWINEELHRLDKDIAATTKAYREGMEWPLDFARLPLSVGLTA